MFRIYLILSLIIKLPFHFEAFQHEEHISKFNKIDTAINKTDTIRINPDSIRGEENLSPLDLKKDKYSIGDTIVDLKQFRFFKTTKLSSLISKNPDLTYLARVNVKSGSHQYDINPKADTIVSFGKLRRKYLPKKNKYTGYNTGFRNECPPSSCYYYYICQTTNGTIKTITNPQQLVTIINHVRSAADAFFLVDDFEYVTGRYEETKSGFFILINKRVADCPMSFADILYFVSKKGNVKAIGRNMTHITSTCI